MLNRFFKPIKNNRIVLKGSDILQKTCSVIKAVKEKTNGYLKAPKFYMVPRTTLFRLSQNTTIKPVIAADFNVGGDQPTYSCV